MSSTPGSDDATATEEMSLVNGLLNGYTSVAATAEAAADVEGLLLSSQEQNEEQLLADFTRSPSPTQNTEDPEPSGEEGGDQLCGQEPMGGTPTSHESPSPLHHVKTSSWWAPLIKGHLSDQYAAIADAGGVHLGPGQPPRRLLSACSGSCAEAEVLKDTRL